MYLSPEQLKQLEQSLLEIPGKFCIPILNFLNQINAQSNMKAASDEKKSVELKDEL